MLGTPFQTPSKRKEQCANKKPSLGIRVPVICLIFSIPCSLYGFPCGRVSLPVLTLPIGAEGRYAPIRRFKKAAIP